MSLGEDIAGDAVPHTGRGGARDARRNRSMSRLWKKGDYSEVRSKREEGRSKREEGRGKTIPKEEGRGKREEGSFLKEETINSKL